MRGVSTIVAALAIIAVTVALSFLVLSLANVKTPSGTVIGIESARACVRNGHVFIEVTIYSNKEVLINDIEFELVTSNGFLQPDKVVTDGGVLAPGENTVFVIVNDASKLPSNEKSLITLKVGGESMSTASIDFVAC